MGLGAGRRSRASLGDVIGWRLEPASERRPIPRRRQASTPCHPTRPALVREHVNPAGIPRCNFDPQPTGADPSPGGSNMFRKFTTVIRKEDGNDMIEYALLAAFISIVAIVALQAIGPLVLGIYNDIQGALGG